MALRITLLGRSGAGKTTVATCLRETHGFTVCSTGRRCRELAQEFFETESKETLNALTDAMRSIDPAVWLKVALRQVGNDTYRVVIDAARFPEDYEYARNRDFRVWRVVCPPEIRRARMASRGQLFVPADEEHITEVALDDAECDAVIDNTQDLETLRRTVRDALQLLDVR